MEWVRREGGNEVNTSKEQYIYIHNTHSCNITQ